MSDLRKRLGLPTPFSSEDIRVFPYLLAIIELLEGIEAALLPGGSAPPHKAAATAGKVPGKPRTSKGK